MRNAKTTKELRESAGTPARYRVLKVITLEDGRTALPGETVTDDGWPYGRGALLVDQRYLLPLEGASDAE